MQGLPLVQAPHIVQPRVKLQFTTTIALQASARYALTLEHHHATPPLCQLTGTDETSESTAYDYYVVLHLT